jgi:hypothetical protein
MRRDLREGVLPIGLKPDCSQVFAGSATDHGDLRPMGPANFRCVFTA